LSLAPAGPDIQFDPNEIHLDSAQVSVDADGDFVATWDVMAGGGGPGETVYEWPEVQRYDRAGNALGAVIRPDDLALRPGVVPAPGATEHLGFGPNVATDDAGNFVVAWMASSGDPQNVLIHVLARRYGADGQPLGPTFRIDPPTSHIISEVDSIAVAMNGSGQFVVTWLDQPEGAFAQRYDAAGQAVGGPVQVDGPGGTNRELTRVATDDTGRFAVVWDEFDFPHNPQGQRVYVRHFGADGRPAGPKNLVTTVAIDDADYRIYPRVDMDADGDTLVSLSSVAGGLSGQRYSATGNPVGGSIHFASGAGGIAMEADGDMVAFSGRQSSGTGGTYLQQFTQSGDPSGDAVFVHSDGGGPLRVAVNNDGSRAVVAWDEGTGPQGFTVTVARPYVAGPGGGATDNKPPTTTGLADVAVDAGTPAGVVPLTGAFNDDRDAGALTYAVRDNSNPGLFSSVTVNSATGMLTLFYAPGQTGEANLTITATDTGGLSVAAPLNVTVRPAAPTPDPDPTPLPPLPAGTKVVTGRLLTRAAGSRRKVAAAGVAVFLDANANGAHDANEPVATSAANGFYSFTGLAAGKYQVRLADGAWQSVARAGKPPRPVIVPARRRKAVRAKPMLLAAAP
jgi:hypothetical protein